MARLSTQDRWMLVTLMIAGVAMVLLRVTPLEKSDWWVEAWRAYEPLLRDGDLDAFFERSPGYVGFIALVGLPATLMARVVGGGAGLIFVLTALPGLSALAWLGSTLARDRRDAGVRAWWMFGAIAVLNPLTWSALHYGHPEDLLAAACCVLAVLTARDGRPVAVIVLLTVALLAKQWAILAVLPAAVAAPRGGIRILIGAGIVTVAVLALQFALHPLAAHTLQGSGPKFHTRQIWYPLGVEVDRLRPGMLKGERAAPAWLSRHAHTVVVGLGGVISMVWWLLSRRRRVGDLLALCSLIFLTRCLFDPWNVPYYHLPLVLFILAWEVRAERVAPTGTFLVATFVFLTFLGWDKWTGPVGFFVYMAWSLPLAAIAFRQSFLRLERRSRSPV